MKFWLLLFFSVSSIAFAQKNDCKCCTESHAAFDFWVGEWEVFNTQGVKIGENEVVILEDHCIINENWASTRGNTGKSYNYYDPKDETWNQLWISNTGNILKLKGGFDGTSMVLTSEIKTNKRGSYYDQIRWTLQEDGSVHQEWFLLDGGKKQINKQFHGIYRRKDT